MLEIRYGMSLDDFTPQLDPIKPIQSIKYLHSTDMLIGIRINQAPFQCIILSPMRSLAKHPKSNIAFVHMSRFRKRASNLSFIKIAQDNSFSELISIVLTKVQRFYISYVVWASYLVVYWNVHIIDDSTEWLHFKYTDRLRLWSIWYCKNIFIVGEGIV